MQTAHEQLESLLDLLRTGPKNEEVCDKISVLCRGYMEPTELNAEREIGVLRLTKSERRLVNALLCKLGNMVSKGALLDAITYDHIHDVPEIKIVDIWVCKVRQKMEEAQSAYRIDTVWGEGYKMSSRSEPNRASDDERLNGRYATITAITRLINKSEQEKAA